MNAKRIPSLSVSLHLKFDFQFLYLSSLLFIVWLFLFRIFFVIVSVAIELTDCGTDHIDDDKVFSWIQIFSFSFSVINSVQFIRHHVLIADNTFAGVVVSNFHFFVGGCFPSSSGVLTWFWVQVKQTNCKVDIIDRGAITKFSNNYITYSYNGTDDKKLRV